jgi:HK97 family phage major capsid protein
MPLNSPQHKLASSWESTLKEMRKMLNEAGGKPLTDAAFETFRSLEDEADSLAGRVSTALGEPWGPRIDPSSARAERLRTREEWAQRSGRMPAFLEDTAPGGSGGYGGGGSEFRSLGEQLQSIVRASTPGMPVDQRLYAERTTGANELVGAEGGFLLGREFATDLLTRAWQQATIAPKCRQFSIPQNRSALDLPAIDETSRVSGSRLGGVRGYWLAENASGTPTKPKLRSISLKPAKLAIYLYASNELAEDASVLGDFVSNCFSEEASFCIDDSLVRGDGAGKPLGILNSGCLVSVAKTAGQIADTFTYANAVAMMARLKPGSAGKAGWFINQEVLTQLPLMTLDIWNSPKTDIVGGSAVYVPSTGDANAPWGRLLGMPVFVIESASALGDVGDVILANWNDYVVARRGGPRFDQSIHVEYLSDQSVFRMLARLDGQPIDKSPLTPYLGSATVSSFITLDAR